MTVDSARKSDFVHRIDIRLCAWCEAALVVVHAHSKHHYVHVGDMPGSANEQVHVNRLTPATA